MFCVNLKNMLDTDHYVVKIVALEPDKVTILHNGVPITKDPICATPGSFVIYGGYSAGDYVVKTSTYAELFLIKDGQAVEEFIIDSEISFHIERYQWIRK